MKAKKRTKRMVIGSMTKGAKEGRLSMGKQKDQVIFPVAPPVRTMPQSYALFLSDLKNRIRQDRLRVVLASNAALVILYWDIGWSRRNESVPIRAVRAAAGVPGFLVLSF